jgi:membrane protein implicated in regulation of membrane protease activity
MATKNKVVLIFLCVVGLMYFFMSAVPLIQGAQVVPAVPVPDPSWAKQVESLGLVGFMLVAGWVLWNAYQATLKKKDEDNARLQREKDEAVAKKDDLLMALVAKVTESLGSMQEFRHSVDESVVAKNEMVQQLRSLQTQISRLPCTLK